MEFRDGQPVHVEFDGYVWGDLSDESWIGVVDSGTDFIHKIWRDDASRIVTPLSPDHWPPQIGDIWEADGEEFFVRKHAMRDSSVIAPFDGGIMFYNYDLDEFKDLNPTLIRRRGEVTCSA